MNLQECGPTGTQKCSELRRMAVVIRMLATQEIHLPELLSSLHVLDLIAAHGLEGTPTTGIILIMVSR
jgi:hypothetical protein